MDSDDNISICGPLVNASSGDHNCTSVGSGLPLLTSIQLPCFVNTIDRAIQCLGGDEKVRNHLQTSSALNSIAASPLTVKLSNNPFQRGVDSTSNPCGGFLVKLKRTVRRRRLQQHQPTEPSPMDVDSADEVDSEVVVKQSAEVMGFINRTIDFNRPFDCQVSLC